MCCQAGRACETARVEETQGYRLNWRSTTIHGHLGPDRECVRRCCEQTPVEEDGTVMVAICCADVEGVSVAARAPPRELHATPILGDMSLLINGATAATH